jgi:hypothetical protein
MSSAGQLMYVGRDTIDACSSRWARSSSQTLASCSAFSTALTVFGFLAANSSVKAQTFSGWSFHMSCVVMPVKPMPSAMARAFQGSPTQKPSILSTFMLATIWGGGMVMRATSLSG